MIYLSLFLTIMTVIAILAGIVAFEPFKSRNIAIIGCIGIVISMVIHHFYLSKVSPVLGMWLMSIVITIILLSYIFKEAKVYANSKKLRDIAKYSCIVLLSLFMLYMSFPAQVGKLQSALPKDLKQPSAYVKVYQKTIVEMSEQKNSIKLIRDFVLTHQIPKEFTDLRAQMFVELALK